MYFSSKRWHLWEVFIHLSIPMKFSFFWNFKENLKMSPFCSKCHLLTPRWHLRCHLLNLYNNWKFVFFIEKVTPFGNFIHLSIPMKFSFFWSFKENFKVPPFCSKCHLLTPKCHLLKLYNNWEFVFFVEKVITLGNFYPPQYPYEIFVLLKF